jgi:glycosyltransferase involved in cell wall biosynthesis
MTVLSVVIATRNRAQFLERALLALEAQHEAPPFEAIVIDNGSSDSTPAVVRAAQERGKLDLRGLVVPRPNRGAARNAGIARARGALVLFIDDDVWLPARFLAAHAAAHAGASAAQVVSGPIVDVPSYATQPAPTWRNYSGAFLCTCNASLPHDALVAAGAFDENFDLYGWEDTDLGLRLRRRGVRHAFAWEAYLWHVKPPRSETLEVVLQKTVERARMAALLLRKDGGWRTKLATGAFGPNLARAAVLAPQWLLPFFRRVADDPRAPAAVRGLARAQLLDGTYTATLRGALADARAAAGAGRR